jgi:hypothetical protein
MASNVLGFGIEAEMSAEPKSNQRLNAIQHYARLADILSFQYHIPARPNTTGSKYPPDYKKWWITNDSSINVTGNAS